MIIYCLFCTKPFPSRDDVMSHMMVSGSHDLYHMLALHPLRQLMASTLMSSAPQMVGTSTHN